jgi:hypothetical protein
MLLKTWLKMPVLGWSRTGRASSWSARANVEAIEIESNKANGSASELLVAGSATIATMMGEMGEITTIT